MQTGVLSLLIRCETLEILTVARTETRRVCPLATWGMATIRYKMGHLVSRG